MLSNALTVALANAKLLLAAAVGAALVAGGGAVAISNVSADVAPDPAATEQVVTEDASTSVDQSATTTSDGEGGDAVTQVVTSPSDTGTAGIKPDNHGACVSAVARDKKPGESGRDHGKRVSAAAKSCPKGDEDSDDSDDSDEADDDAAKTERKSTKRAEQAERKQAKRAEQAERKQGKRDSGKTDD